MDLHLILVFTVPLLLFACDKGKSRKPSTDDTAPTHDTGPDPDTYPYCDTGYLDDDGECVPVACGTGTWGNLDVDENTVYVDITAAEGGDGSEVAPFTSIQDGLDAAGDADGGMVAVAAGSYPETLELDRRYDGVHLAGRCRDLVVLDASVGDESTPGIDVDAKSSEVEVSGVTVSGSHYPGVRVGSGTMTIRNSAVVESEYTGVGAYQAGIHATALTLEACKVRGNNTVGVAAYGSGTTVALRDTNIEDTQPDEYGELGFGIEIYDGARLDAEGCEVRRNSSAGVLAFGFGTSVTLRETIIEDTQPIKEENDGQGIYVYDDASLEAESCEVRGNTSAGVVALGSGTSVTLRATTIEGTQPEENGERGYGIKVHGGASLNADSCAVRGNTTAGLFTLDSGSSVTLRETSIEDSQPRASGEHGYGILVQDGASLEAEHCEVERNTAKGVVVTGSDTWLTLQESSVEDTQPDENGENGWGILVEDGASLDAEACVVRGNITGGLGVVGSGTTATLRETTIEDTSPNENGDWGHGIETTGGASLDAEACLIRGNAAAGVLAGGSGTSANFRDTSIEDTRPLDSGEYGFGIDVYDGASLDAEACEIRGNTVAGVFAEDSGTEVTLHDTRIVSTMRGEIYTLGIGVCAQASASVVATALELSSNEGPALFAVSEDTFLSCSGSVIQGNQFAGAVVVYGAHLLLAQSHIEGTFEQENIGGGVGIYAEPWDGDPPALTVTDSTIQGNAIAGVWLSGHGSYSLSDNTIHGGEGWTREGLTKCGDAVYARDGVTAWEGSSGLLLRSNELLDGLGAGLFLDDASATLWGNSYADNAVDLVTQGADCATPPDGYDSETFSSGTELCPTNDYATCKEEFAVVLALAEPESGHGAALFHPGLRGPDAMPALPGALPHAFEPAPLLPPAPRLEPVKLRMEPLRHEPASPVPFVTPREH